MKTQSFILSIAFLFVFSNFSFAQTAKKETIKVWGNCGMCKKTIETAATKAGASSAKWDTETKMLSVSYSAKKTNAQKIQEAIAAVGYDTRDLTAPDDVYNKLHGCCQYDRKADEASTKKISCCSNDKCSKDECKGKDCCKGADKDCCVGAANECCKGAGQDCCKAGDQACCKGTDKDCCKDTAKECCKGTDKACCKS